METQPALKESQDSITPENPWEVRTDPKPVPKPVGDRSTKPSPTDDHRDVLTVLES